MIVIRPLALTEINVMSLVNTMQINTTTFIDYMARGPDKYREDHNGGYDSRREGYSIGCSPVRGHNEHPENQATIVLLLPVTSARVPRRACAKREPTEREATAGAVFETTKLVEVIVLVRTFSGVEPSCWMYRKG